MSIKTLLALAVGAFAAWQLTAPSRRSRDAAERNKPRAENNWENEGGALPVTGAQHGPAPELP